MANPAFTTKYGPCHIVMGYRALGHSVPPGKGKLLELGARRAAAKRWVESKGYEYVSIDIDFYPEIHAVGDAHFVPFKDATFDVVLLPCVLEHFRDPRIAMAEVLRILKPGGSVIGQVSFLEPYHRSYWHFSHAALEDCMRVAGFSELTIDTGANAFVLIYARVLASVFNIHNRQFIVRFSRILFPINLVLSIVYGLGVMKNRLLGRDVAAYKARFAAFRKELALRLAGHLIFTATRP